ncbi:MAG: hypothetical protein QGF59_13305 [Pirellulaceae bacterium]|nr:hypothetical protein [Pirellulaceae bacterium]
MLKRKKNADPRQRAPGNENRIELTTKADDPGGEEARQAHTPAEGLNDQKAIPGALSALPMEETGKKDEVFAEDPVSETDSTVEDVAENTGLAVEDVPRQGARLADPRSRHREIVVALEPGQATPPPRKITTVSQNERTLGSRVAKIEKLLPGIGQLFAAKTLPALSDKQLANAARKVGAVFTKLEKELDRREETQNVVFTSLKRHDRTVTQKQKNKLAAILHPPVDDNRAIDVARMVVDLFRDNGRKIFTMNEAIEVVEAIGLGLVLGTKFDQKTGKKIYSQKKARIVLGDQFGRNCLNLRVVSDSKRNRQYHVGRKKTV